MWPKLLPRREAAGVAGEESAATAHGCIAANCTPRLPLAGPYLPVSEHKLEVRYNNCCPLLAEAAHHWALKGSLAFYTSCPPLALQGRISFL